MIREIPRRDIEKSLSSILKIQSNPERMFDVILEYETAVLKSHTAANRASVLISSIAANEEMPPIFIGCMTTL